MSRYRNYRKGAGAFILHILLMLLAAIFVFPVFWAFVSSLKTLGEIFIYPPKIFPEDPYWENYKTVLTGSIPFPRFMLNSLIVALGRTAGVVITSALAAYAFARLRFRGREGLFLIYVGTLVIPFQVTMIPVFVIVRNLHWVDTYLALIVPGMFSAFGTFLLRQFFLTLPRDLEEAAIIDGCSFFRIFWQIILPLSKPALASLSIFTFVGTWNEFLWPLIIINETKMKTVTLGLSIFQGLYFTEWHLVMAATIIAISVPLLLYVFLQKYFVKGIALTGLKA